MNFHRYHAAWTLTHDVGGRVALGRADGRTDGPTGRQADVDRFSQAKMDSDSSSG